MMKKLFLALGLLLLTNPAQAVVQKKLEKNIGHGVTATTIVTKQDVNQTVLVDFTNQQGIKIGTLSLTSGSNRAKNLKYMSGKQKLHIKSIELGLDQYNHSLYSLIINSKVTDVNGANKTAYKGILATWPSW